MQKRLKYTITTFTCTLLLLQALLLFNLLPVIQLPINPGFGGFTQPAAKYDSLIGYRWNSPNAIIYKIVQGDTVYYNKITHNNQGFISKKDFNPTKNKSTKFRWIILGDSFTSGAYLTTTWPDLAETMLATDSIEIYNYGCDGCGIINWYQIYKTEIENKIEYDGLAMAVFCDDLSRGLLAMHHTDSFAYIGTIDTIAKPLNQFISAFHPHQRIPLQGQPENHPCWIWDWITHTYHIIIQKEEFKQMIDQYYTKYVYSSSNYSRQINPTSLSQKFGTSQFNALLHLIKLNQQKGKQTALLAIPEKVGTLYNATGSEVKIALELQFIATQNNLKFINGYKLLDNHSASDLENMYLPHDGHPSPYGVQNFASIFAPELKKISGSPNKE